MRSLLCLLLITLFAMVGGRAADVSGTAVFVKVIGDADDARADVYEQRLAGDDAQLLIAHTALPQTFRGRIEHALPSADGALLLLEESDGYTIRNAKTGATRLVLGSGYMMTGDETLAGQFEGGSWLWSRATGVVKKIALVTAPYERCEPLSWSPQGALLLVRVINDRTRRDTLREFNAGTGKTCDLFSARELPFAYWTHDGAAVLVGEQTTEHTTRLLLVPRHGKAQCLFTRASRVFTAALSPNGHQLALGDKGGFYLCRRDGRVTRKLAPQLAPYGLPGGEMAFSADGSRLAILSTSASASVYADIHEELWAVTTRTAVARRLTRWDVTLGNAPGEDTIHRLLGWVPGQPALLLMGQSCTVQGAETAWCKLWLQPIDPAVPSRLLAATGSYGIDLSWYKR